MLKVNLKTLLSYASEGDFRDVFLDEKSVCLCSYFSKFAFSPTSVIMHVTSKYKRNDPIGWNRGAAQKYVTEAKP